jgi:hypothetical protein
VISLDEELYCSNISGGAHDGVLAIYLHLGDKLFIDLAALIRSILDFKWTRTVLIQGSAPESENEGIRTLIMTLRENGYAVLVSSRGSERPPWLEYATYRITYIDEDPWLCYASNEIHYIPSSPLLLKPPFLTQVHSQSILYVEAGKDMPPREILDFVGKNPHFRIYTKPSRVYRITVPMSAGEGK